MPFVGPDMRAYLGVFAQKTALFLLSYLTKITSYGYTGAKILDSY